MIKKIGIGDLHGSQAALEELLAALGEGAGVLLREAPRAELVEEPLDGVLAPLGLGLRAADHDGHLAREQPRAEHDDGECHEEERHGQADQLVDLFRAQAFCQRGRGNRIIK